MKSVIKGQKWREALSQALSRALRIPGIAQPAWASGALGAFVQRSVRRPAVLGVCAAMLFGAGGYLGHWGTENLVFWKLHVAIRAGVEALSQQSDRQVLTWAKVETGLHTLETAKLKLGRFSGNGGAITEVGGDILFVSPKGVFGYLDAQQRLRTLPIRAPMNLDTLTASPIASKTAFEMTSFRVLDMNTIETAPGAFDLYVSHDRYARDCFEWVVSRIRLAVDAEGIRPASGWDDVFVAKPCIPPKQRGVLFAGEEGGGRIVVRDRNTLLLSIGDHLFDGVNDHRKWAMDPAADYGKIVELNLTTGVSRHVAVGLRNPEGLTIARDGRIWETEHGPRGGDELNLIREGQNYGWPEVSYGTDYGFPRAAWKWDPVIGGHDGYARPAFAWVPSIGASQVVEPDPREFPDWRNHLLVASLRANTLFLVQIDGDAVRYVEPIGFAGKRLRDVISLHDGRLAMLVDGGDLVLVRNAEQREKDATGPLVAGRIVDDQRIATANAQISSAELGHKLFAERCQSCHSLDGQAGAGPALNGVVGRRKGHSPGFAASAALASQEGEWTRAELCRFILQPRKEIPGVAMQQPTVTWKMIEPIVEYLATTRPSGEPVRLADES
jgi:cytochrome c2